MAIDAYHVLGIGPQASAEEIRAAYLGKIREHPPDRSPEEFERVRDAYAELRDPRERARQLLFGGDPMPPLTSLLEGRKAARHYLGPKPWLAAMKDK
jgi:curved DNA-binding protein CbpA